MNRTSTRMATTERYVGWGRLATGASLAVALAADLLGGFVWFEAAVAIGATLLATLGLLTLLAPGIDTRRSPLASALGWSDPIILGLLVVAGPDEDVGYALVLLLLMLTLSALRGLRAYRAAVAIGVVAEAIRQALHPLVGADINPGEALVAVGTAVALSAALARMVELARVSEEDAVRSAAAATEALAEAERAAAQLDVLHRVVVSTIGTQEAEALQRIVTEMATYLGVPAATVFLIDAGGVVRVTATTDPAVAPRDDVARPVPFLDGPLGRALQGQATHATAEELAAMAAAGQSAHGDVCVHPLRRADGTVVGALACGTRAEVTFTVTEDRTVARFADQMSLAIEAARSLHREADLASQYRELDRLKTDFIAITSHELRTPLTTVIGVIETMRQRLDDIERDEMDRLLTALTRQAHRLSRLVDDLGTVSRVDAGTLVTVVRPTDICTVVKEAMAGLPEIDAVLHPTDGGPLAEADPERLLQVVTNLLANGDQHGQGTVHLAVTAEGRDVVLRVWDDGPGIPSARRDEVFERFVRLGETDSHTRGSGLGLAIARELVTAMGGTIAVVDRREGSAFEVRLPVATAPV